MTVLQEINPVHIINTLDNTECIDQVNPVQTGGKGVPNIAVDADMVRMDSSIRNQPTADGTSIVREILASEKSLETAADRVLSTNEAVRVDVFPAHLRETSFDIWLHSSTKEITDPISNTIVSSGGTMASSADGQISSFVDIGLKQVDVDELLTKHHKSMELFEERSLASERPSSPTSSKSFEVLAWVANQEQSSNEHQLKRLDSLDIVVDVHSTGRIMNKSQESCFHSSVISAASKISHVDDAVQCDGENEVRCAQGQEFEMVNGCNSTCHENLRTQSASTTCLTQPLLKSILDAMETKFEAFRRIIMAELGRPDHPDLPPKLFLEYMEACRFNGDKEEVASTVIGELRHIRQQMSSQVRKMDEFLEKAESDKQQRFKATCAEQQTTEIRLQNALTELEITRAEMVKVQRESVRKLALESSKHTEEISIFEKENAATAHALEQIQTEARLLKSSLESSLSKNESALVQLGKTKGQLEEALDRENSLKLELKELQNQLSSMVKEKDEYSYKHTEEISSLEEKNTVTVHALEQTQTEASQLKSSLESSLLKNESDVMHLVKTEGKLEEALDRENSLKLELKELQNQLSAVVKKKDEDSYKHAEQISSLEEKNAATVHALEQTEKEASQLKSSLESSLLKNESDLIQLAKTKDQLEEALGREDVLKIELEKLQNELCALTDEKDKNESRPEATFRYMIPNFTKALGSSLSDATIVRNLQWRISARKENSYLTFYLQCTADSDSASWSCKAKAELRLVSQKEGVKSFTRKMNQLFKAEGNSVGWEKFMSLSDICNPENGYIKDDCVILEVHLVAKTPSRYQFGFKEGYWAQLKSLHFINQLKKDSELA